MVHVLSGAHRAVLSERRAPTLRRCLMYLATIGVASCTSTMPLVAQSSAEAQRASLVVVLVVDQMRPDYFTRWGSQLTAASHASRNCD